MNTCPICQTTLRQVAYQHLALGQCESCSGFWFREGQFREAKQLGFVGLQGTVSPKYSREESANETAETPQRLCPDCDIPLVPYTYAYSSGIQLHRCARCSGIWASYADLLHIEELLAGYQESLEEAKAKVMPLMMQVKQQIQKEEAAREKERQEKGGMFQRIFRRAGRKNRRKEHPFDDVDPDKQGMF